MMDYQLLDYQLLDYQLLDYQLQAISSCELSAAEIVITTVVGHWLLAISCWHLYPVSCYRTLFSRVVFCPVSFPG